MPSARSTSAPASVAPRSVVLSSRHKRGSFGLMGVSGGYSSVVERLKTNRWKSKNAWEFQPEFVVVRNKYLAMETATRKSKTFKFNHRNRWAESDGFSSVLFPSYASLSIASIVSAFSRMGLQLCSDWHRSLNRSQYSIPVYYLCKSEAKELGLCTRTSLQQASLFSSILFFFINE